MVLFEKDRHPKKTKILYGNSSAIRRTEPLYQYGSQRRLTTIFFFITIDAIRLPETQCHPLFTSEPYFSPRSNLKKPESRHSTRGGTPWKIEQPPEMMKLAFLQNLVHTQPRHYSSQLSVNHSIEQNPKENNTETYWNCSASTLARANT